MDEKASPQQPNQKRTTGWLVALVVVLLAVLAFQSWHLYRLENQINTAFTQPPQAMMANQNTPRVLPFQQPKTLAPAAPPQSATQPQISFAAPFGFQSSPGSSTWDPFAEMNRMQQEMDQLFKNAFSRFHTSPQFQGLTSNPVFSPRLDLQDKGDEYLVKVDMPGMDQAKIETKVENQNLIITGESNEVNKGQQQNGTALWQERKVGHFERTIPLPGPVKSANIEVSYNDGVLTVQLPKA